MKDQPLVESLWLEGLLLNGEQCRAVDDAVLEIREHPYDFKLTRFWGTENSIGGVSGRTFDKGILAHRYFGVARGIFRPLQYAVMFLLGSRDKGIVYETAKWSVHNSGLHMEAAAKYRLAQKDPILGVLRTNRYTLGNSLREIRRRHLLPESLLEPFGLLCELHNKAKHEINQSLDREWLFAPGDALICYLAARIIGTRY